MPSFVEIGPVVPEKKSKIGKIYRRNERQTDRQTDRQTLYVRNIRNSITCKIRKHNVWLIHLLRNIIYNKLVTVFQAILLRRCLCS